MKTKLMLAALAIFAAAHTSTYAKEYEPPVCVTVNGSYVNMESKPFLENGVTYIPVRCLSDIFGAENIAWNEQTKKATVVFNGQTIVLEEGKNTAVINGKSTKMNGTANNINGRIYVPVRFFAETFGADVSWAENYFRAEITKSGLSVSDEVITKKNYDDEHIYWLAKIINCESSGENIDGKIGVGNVILNRVENSSFPNSIYGVIFDNKHGVQFQPVSNGTINNAPDKKAYLAAKLALEGENTAGNSLYFLNPKIATNFWIPSSRTFYKTIGNHDFYL